MAEGAVIVGYGGLHLSVGRRTTRHALHALKLLVPLEGTLLYEGAGTIRSNVPVLVPADHEHAASCDGVSLCVFIPPEVREGRLRGLARSDRPRITRGAVARRLFALGRSIGRGLEHASTDDHARMLDEVVATLTMCTATSAPIDPRVRSVLAALDDDAAPPIAGLADTVALSRSHLAHLVKAEIGISLAHRTLFRKLMAAHRRVLAGVPLAAAAADAGFADHAHFSRTTRRMLGQPPSFVAASAFKTAARDGHTLVPWTPS